MKGLFLEEGELKLVSGCVDFLLQRLATVEIGENDEDTKLVGAMAYAKDFVEKVNTTDFVNTCPNCESYKELAAPVWPSPFEDD